MFEILYATSCLKVAIQLESMTREYQWKARQISFIFWQVDFAFPPFEQR